jgi:uncharacterized membrane protein YgcG
MMSYICPDPGCDERSLLKGLALDHMNIVHDLQLPESQRWAAMTHDEFQELLNETWKHRPRPSSQDEPSPTLDLQPSASVPIDDEATTELPSLEDVDVSVSSEQSDGAFEAGGGDFGGGGGGSDFGSGGEPGSEGS